MFNLKVRRGFTLVEIMLVVVIIGILMAVVVPRMATQSSKAKIKAARASIHGISTALGTFEVKASRFPSTQEGLQALVTKPQDLSEDEWEGPYLKEFPKDPFGEDFVYKSPGDVNKDFDLISKGPDKQENTPDDINNFPKTTEAQ